jgi:hypothetical protein
VAAIGIGVWCAGAAIIPSLTDPEQNLARIAKQVAAGPKNSDDNRRMKDELDKALRNYLSKQANLPTPDVVKKLQKVLPATAFEAHAIDLPRGLRVVEVDTVLQASDYLLMKGSSGFKVFPLSGLEVFDDARLINESAGPMLVAIGHSGGQPPHHPQIKVYALLPDDIADETEKLLPPLHGEGSARFAKNGRDIVLDLSLLSLGQVEQLFAAGPQSEDGTVHQDLDWKEAHYTSRYEYGSSPFVALYAVARCMRYPDLTATHRQFLGTQGYELVQENKSQDAGNFKVKRLPASGDRLAYQMTGSVGTFVVELGKVNGVWAVVGTRNAPSSTDAVAVKSNTTEQPKSTTAEKPVVEQTASVQTAPVALPEPAPARAPIVEKTLSATAGKPASDKLISAGTSTTGAETAKKADSKKEAARKAEQDKLAQQKLEQQKQQDKLEQQKIAKKKLEEEKLAQKKLDEQKLAQKKLDEQKLELKKKKEAEQKKIAEQKKPSEQRKEDEHTQAAPQVSAASGQAVVIAAGTVNIRLGANTDAKPVAAVSKGASLEIAGKQNGWYKVRYHGQEGFIYAGLVDYKKPDAYTTATVTKARKVRDNNKKALASSQAGDRVVILGGLENNKYKVQLANGKTGYVEKDAVDVKVDEPQFVP